MSWWIEIAAIVVSAVLLVPVAVLCVECLAAVVAPRRKRAPETRGGRARVAVVIPAHNEEVGIAGTIRSIKPQLLKDDALVVVADNCTDRTAEVARELGATVIERHDEVNRGKGFALDRGIRELESDPPDVVVMVDADCRVGEGAIAALVNQVAMTGRPAQAAYVMDCPPGSGPKASISALAFIVKNVVRPLGLKRLGLPCLLTGTGMGFPWKTIRDAHLATGNIVEDMQLGIDLALAGEAPLACPEARVLGTIESKSSVALTQRRRWEHGHLATMLTNVPRLLIGGVWQASPRLGALALEVAVPPLALLVVLLGMASVAAGTWGVRGGSMLPAAMLTSGCVMLATCILLAWARFARSEVPLKTLVTIPVYVAWKVPLYCSFLFKREKQWVRTYRGGPSDTADASGLLSPVRS